jgi:hypothetical protein
MDKNKAVIDFLMTCDYIKNSPLFFNFGQAKSDNKQIITIANDVRINEPFIDGSIRKRYTFTIIDYKSVAYNAVVMRTVNNASTPVSENLDTAFEARQVAEWIEEQNDARNYPDFGEDCTIDDMVVGTNEPNVNGVDRSITPALAKYSISIKIDYIDYSKVIWK